MAQSSAQLATKKAEVSHDPRVDPQQGDIVVATRTGAHREVLERADLLIIYDECRLGGLPKTRRCVLSTWKAWCSTNKAIF